MRLRHDSYARDRRGDPCGTRALENRTWVVSTEAVAQAWRGRMAGVVGWTFHHSVMEGKTSAAKLRIKTPKDHGRRAQLGTRVGLRAMLRAAAIVSVFALGAVAVPACAATCKKVSFEGDVAEGKTWVASLGQGWVLKLLPISPTAAGYSGWDLVVDREAGSGYPDALFLATPPYGSLNEREIGTTFGLRAQDAIGWNPRDFRFLLDPRRFTEAQQIFRELLRNGALQRASQGTMSAKGLDQQALARLMSMQENAAPGELHILDARLIPGTGDPESYARNWSIASGRTPHETDAAPAGAASPRGRLVWIRFAIDLTLPEGWALPPRARGTRVSCEKQPVSSRF